MILLLSSWPGRNWRIRPARWLRAGFRKFSGKKSCIARPRRGRAGLTVYPPMIQIRDVAPASYQWCDRKSKFGLRHAIKLNMLYCITKSEFWFSMIPPRTRGSNVASSVLLNYTVTFFKRENDDIPVRLHIQPSNDIPVPNYRSVKYDLQLCTLECVHTQLQTMLQTAVCSSTLL
jgi:hypothetical protein